MCNSLLPEKIMSFNKSHPQVDFQVFEGSSNHVMDLLNDGSIDVGIIREPFNTSLYHSLAIRGEDASEEATDAFAAIGLPNFFEGITGNEINLAQLKGKPLIIHRRYNDLIMNACRQQGFSPNIICQNTETASSISWAEAGIGVAVAPYTAAIQYMNDRMVSKTIVQPTLHTKSFLVWRKDTHLANIVQQFIHLFE